MNRRKVINWEMSEEKANEIIEIHKSGLKNWEQLTLEYMEDHGIELTTTPDKHKEYFRRLVGKTATKDGRGGTIDRMFDLMTNPIDDEITIDYIHAMTKMSRKEFYLKDNIKTSAWGTMGQKEFETAFRNGSIKLTWGINHVLFDEEKYLETLQKVKKIIIPKPSPRNTREHHLLITPFDSHFGIATIEDYEVELKRYVETITMYKREKITIIVGQDTIHTNDNKGHTANLTPIGRIDLNKALDDADTFYSTLIEASLKWAQDVEVIYSKGNHDETTGLMVIRTLRPKYNDRVKFDIGLEDYKARPYGNVAMGFTHGENVPTSRKGKQRLHDAYMNMFPKFFNVTKKRYVFTGHYHNLQVIDEAGTIIYTLSTAVKNDEYHTTKAFVSAHKNFNAFEFTKNGMYAHYFIH